MVQEKGNGLMENSREKICASFGELLDVCLKLTASDGCPWDREQTSLSMRKNILDECTEVVDAITEGDDVHVREEMGDLFFNLMLTGLFAGRDGRWNLRDCFDEIRQKLIRRHPHVFSDQQGISRQEIRENWERIKNETEGRRKDFVLDQVPQGFDALSKSSKYISKAAKCGFDWKGAEDASSKVQEELEEANEAYRDFLEQGESQPLTVSAGGKGRKEFLHLEEECGDLLFSCVNLVKKMGVDPVVALGRANSKFYGRFGYVMENLVSGNELDAEARLAEMEQLWSEAKKAGL